MIEVPMSGKLLTFIDTRNPSVTLWLSELSNLNPLMALRVSDSPRLAMQRCQKTTVVGPISLHLALCLRRFKRF